MLSPDLKDKIVIRVTQHPDTPNWTSLYGGGSKSLTALFKTDNPSEATQLMREIGVSDVSPFSFQNFVPEIPGFGVGLTGVLLNNGKFEFGSKGPVAKKILLNLSSEGLIADETVLKAIAALA